MANIYDLNDLIEYDPGSQTTTEPALKSSTWTKSETLQLIDLYDQYRDTFNHVKQRKHAWTIISTHLQAQDVMKSTTDCSNKWNNLQRTYKSCKDNKNKTGRGPIRFEFFEQMDEILGKKDSNASEVVGTSVGLANPSSEILENPTDNEEDNGEPAPKIKRKRLSAKSEYYKLKMEKMEKRDKREEEFLKIENEKLDLIRKIADGFTNSI